MAWRYNLIGSLFFLPFIAESLVVEQSQGGRWPWEKKEAAPSPCKAPLPGEKVIFYVQHGSAESEEEEWDLKLDKLGEEQARALRTDPRLAGALSDDPAQRAELVIVAPMRRTLHTALLAFGDKLHDVKWMVNPDIKGNTDNFAVPEFGRDLLKNMNATWLLQEYNTNYDREKQGAADARWKNYVDMLRARPEQRIIVVTFAHECGLADVDVSPGAVRIAALVQDTNLAGKHGSGWFRAIGQPQNWPQFLKEPECQTATNPYDF